MEKIYCKIDFYCPNQKCSEYKLRKVKQNLKKYITKRNSQNNLAIKLTDEIPPKEEGMRCSCRWSIYYQKQPAPKTSNKLYTILFEALDPKIINIKKQNGKAKRLV